MITAILKFKGQSGNGAILDTVAALDASGLEVLEVTLDSKGLEARVRLTVPAEKLPVDEDCAEELVCDAVGYALDYTVLILCSLTEFRARTIEERWLESVEAAEYAMEDR